MEAAAAPDELARDSVVPGATAKEDTGFQLSLMREELRSLQQQMSTLTNGVCTALPVGSQGVCSLRKATGGAAAVDAGDGS